MNKKNVTYEINNKIKIKNKEKSIKENIQQCCKKVM